MRYGMIWRALAGVMALVMMAGTAAARVEEGPVPTPPRAHKIKVLIVTGGHEFDAEPFFKMFTDQPDFEVIRVEQPEAQKFFAGDKADSYDVMVWYDMYKDISDEARENLVELLKEGKPLLVMHHALANYSKWDEIVKIIGGQYRFVAKEGEETSTFKHDQTVNVKIADPDHPITRFAEDFVIQDEIYGNVKTQPGIKPLLTTDHPESMKTLAWVNHYGNSDVVYVQGGHDAKAYNNPHYRRFVAQSVRWLAGALPDPSDDGFKKIFNGKNLDGWVIKGDPKGFKVVDGVIRSDIPRIGHYIHTDRVYEDFILRIDWRISENGNSGVFIRATGGMSPWLDGSEVQISNEPRNDIHCTASLYGDVAVNPRPDESYDQWHHLEIHCCGSMYKVFADNIPVIDVDASEIANLRVKPKKGFIGMQDFHVPDETKGCVEYRNIMVKELPPMDKKACGARSCCAKKEEKWRLGMQCWTFNHLTLFETIDMAQKLGIKYLEIYPGQKMSRENPEPFTPDSPREMVWAIKNKARQAGVTLTNLGVIKFTNDKNENAKYFDWALMLDITTINCEPQPPEAIKTADEQARMYRTSIAIHNHPKPSTYWDCDFVYNQIKDCSPWVGVCADTGHWLRSGLEPIECIKKLKGRIMNLHLKDLNEKGNVQARDVVYGQGVADVPAILKELKAQGFDGQFTIEYEHKSDKLVEEVKACVEAFHKMAGELGMD